jgi:hypothetical protein
VPVYLLKQYPFVHTRAIFSKPGIELSGTPAGMARAAPAKTVPATTKAPALIHLNTSVMLSSFFGRHRTRSQQPDKL